MNVENLSNAHYIYNEMKELQRQKGILESGAGLGVTIQSAYQYSAFLEAIRPHAVAELNSRIEEKKSALVNWVLPSLYTSIIRRVGNPPKALRNCVELWKEWMPVLPSINPSFDLQRQFS